MNIAYLCCKQEEEAMAAVLHHPVVRTLVEVLKPFKGRVYDPCCGSGGMFVLISAVCQENHLAKYQ